MAYQVTSSLKGRLGPGSRSLMPSGWRATWMSSPARGLECMHSYSQAVFLLVWIPLKFLPVEMSTSPGPWLQILLAFQNSPAFPPKCVCVCMCIHTYVCIKRRENNTRVSLSALRPWMCLPMKMQYMAFQ